MKFLIAFVAALACASAAEYPYHHQPIATGIPTDVQSVQHATAEHLAHPTYPQHHQTEPAYYPAHPVHYPPHHHHQHYPEMMMYAGQHAGHFQHELATAVSHHHDHHYTGGAYVVKPESTLPEHKYPHHYTAEHEYPQYTTTPTHPHYGQHQHYVMKRQVYHTLPYTHHHHHDSYPFTGHHYYY